MRGTHLAEVLVTLKRGAEAEWMARTRRDGQDRDRECTKDVLRTNVALRLESHSRAEVVVWHRSDRQVRAARRQLGMLEGITILI